MNHRDTEAQRDPITEKVIDAAIEVHRHLGPGLLESAYEKCLCWELREAGMTVREQVPVSVRYKEIELGIGYRLDLVVEDRLIVELKTVEKILPVHEAQVLTYLKLSGLRTGLVLNFAVAVLKDGIRRLVL